MKFIQLIYLFLQQLVTERGAHLPYRPLFGEINNNLKRTKIWNSVEVHSIYAFVYTLCTSRTGLLQLRTYFLTQMTEVYDPVFIAQYLLVPVNTIVKNTLLPWMMRPYFHLWLDKSLTKKTIIE